MLIHKLEGLLWYFPNSNRASLRAKLITSTYMLNELEGRNLFLETNSKDLSKLGVGVLNGKQNDANY